MKHKARVKEVPRQATIFYPQIKKRFLFFSYWGYLYQKDIFGLLFTVWFYDKKEAVQYLESRLKLGKDKIKYHYL